MTPVCTDRYIQDVSDPTKNDAAVVPEKNSASRILDAALELFAEKGYEAASIREICERAGITRPTLYYFFESKEGLYRALVAEATREFDRTVNEGLASAPDLRGKFKGVARKFFEDVVQRPTLVRFVYGLVWSTTNSPFAQELHKAYMEMIERMSAAAREAARNGEISGDRIDLHMIVLMGSLGEAISCYLFLGTELTPELADGIVDIVFDGWK